MPRSSQLASDRPPASTDVLVVGFGPVGAALACLLGRYGVSTVVVDKADGILMHPRAIALDNEGQRVLQLAGLADDAFEKLAVRECRLQSPWFGEFARFTTTGVVDGYARLVSFYQPDMERALRKEAANHKSVSAFGGIEMLGFSESQDEIATTLRLHDGATTEVRSRYLLGADGAGSLVRKLIGQDFRGTSYAQDWLIVDATGCPQRMDHIDFHCRKNGARPHIPAPGGRQRWEFMLEAGQSPERMESDEEIRRLLAPWGNVSTMQIERRAVYRFHARCCERFQRGRVFLVGDAAHITPPFAGQGLMSGLRDAANLCWKLAWVLQGRANSRVLDSYDTERRPHAKAMIDLARKMGAIIMPVQPLKAFLLHGTLRLLRTIGPVRRSLEDMRIKPTPNFHEGLFVSATRRAFRLAAGGRRLERGGLLPQALVRDAHGITRLSDDVLGGHLTLVGFGVDPREGLHSDEQRRWLAAGGNFVQFARRGQVSVSTQFSCEDLTGLLVPGAAPPGWIAVVRPDRTVLHDGQASDVTKIVAESLSLLGVPHGDERRAALHRPLAGEQLHGATP